MIGGNPMKKFSVWGVCAIFFAAGCAEDAPDDLIGNNNNGGTSATLSIEGSYSVQVGETLTLTVTTEGGTDESYTFESENLGVASVADGVITGLAAGETVITVTGNDTGAVGNHPVVVQEEPIDDEVPFLAQWQSSAHSDQGSESFRHWDEDGEIPTRCAKCHSSTGLQDYMGNDGSAVRSVDSPAALGTVVDCNACHNPAALNWDTVTFPATATAANPEPVSVTGLGREAVCMECHQGRSSGAAVDEDIAEAGVTDPDEVSENLGIVNPHYYPAAATLFASAVGGGYEYDPVPGPATDVYDSRFRHVPGVNTCTDCHDAHTLQIKFDTCTECHAEATDLQGARDIRMIASQQDYDGDGNTTEGIFYELDTLRTDLFASLLQYAAERGPDSRICYDNGRYPYFFKDDDLDGDCPDGAAPYDQWTARLVKGAYNYLLATTERGAFAHNAKYIIQLLVDSIRDLNAGISGPNQITPSSARDWTRSDVGHFNGASEAARHWDDRESEPEITDQQVSASCSACHSGSEGFRFFTTYGVGLTVNETANGLDCYTCHEDFGTQPADYVLYMPEFTQWPDGTQEDLGADNLCANCHAGRANTATYNARFAAGNYSFSNVHYYASAAQVYGSEAAGGYQYPGETYAGRFNHAGLSSAPVTCEGCHDAVVSEHTFDMADVFNDPNASCGGGCHGGQNSPEEILGISLGRGGTDFDGDGLEIGDTDGDGVLVTPKRELDGLAAQVLAGLGAAGICAGNDYPYFFNANAAGSADGLCDPTDVNYGNRVQDWGSTDAERELRLTAAHNWGLYDKSPGAYAHNFDYMGQLLYDSACRLGSLSADATRPAPASVFTCP